MSVHNCSNVRVPGVLPRGVPAVQDFFLVAKMEGLHELLPDASQNSVAPLTRRAKQTARVTPVKIDQQSKRQGSILVLTINRMSVFGPRSLCELIRQGFLRTCQHPRFERTWRRDYEVV